MHKRDGVYYIGVIVTFLGIAGIAEAVTGRGSILVAASTFAVGFVCVLAGYMK